MDTGLSSRVAPQGVHGQSAVCVTSRVWRAGADYPEGNSSTDANEPHPTMLTAQRCGAEGNAARTGGSESIQLMHEFSRHTRGDGAVDMARSTGQCVAADGQVPERAADGAGSSARHRGRGDGGPWMGKSHESSADSVSTSAVDWRGDASEKAKGIGGTMV